MKFKWIVLVVVILCGTVSAQEKKPNVLFIICDDLNLSEGCYGNQVVKTPNIDRLAARGVRFERAYCNWPLCLPSRHSIMSGRRPDAKFAANDFLRKRLPDVEYIPEYFRKNGYYTARVGKIFHTHTIFKGIAPLEDPACWDTSITGSTKEDPCGYSVLYGGNEQGLAAHPELQEIVVFHDLLNTSPGGPAGDYWMERVALKLDDTQTIDGNIAGITNQLLQVRAGDKKPFFIAAGFRRPHLLWTAPKKYFDMYNADEIKLPVEPAGHEDLVPKIAFTRRAPNMTDQERKMAIQSYYACVSSVDHQVGVLMDQMDKLKLWDNTIVFFTSDHGWHLDEHGLWGKVSLFEESAKVPLIVVAPGVKPAVVPTTVEMIDYYPTLAEMAGLPKPQRIDGVSLVAQLKNPEEPHGPAFSVLRHAKTWGKAVYTTDWRYTEWGDDASKGAELYDLRSDPKEYRNLANDAKFAEQRAVMKKLLDPVTGKLRDADTAGAESD